MRNLWKTALALLMACAMVLTLLPTFAIAEKTQGRIETASARSYGNDWSVPDGYDPWEYSEIVSFLDQYATPDHSLGEVLNPNFDANDPTTWLKVTMNNEYYTSNGEAGEEENCPLVVWELVDDVYHVKELHFDGFNEFDIQNSYDLCFYEMHYLTAFDCVYVPLYDFYLSNCENLEELNLTGCECYEFKVYDCPAIKRLACAEANFGGIDLSGCEELVSFDCRNCEYLTKIKMPQNLSPLDIVVIDTNTAYGSLDMTFDLEDDNSNCTFYVKPYMESGANQLSLDGWYDQNGNLLGDDTAYTFTIAENDGVTSITARFAGWLPYNEHDVEKLLGVLERGLEYGCANGAVDNPYFTPDIPSTWNFERFEDVGNSFYWVESNGELRIRDATITLVDGELDLSGCSMLETLSCSNSGTTSIIVDDCDMLNHIDCSNNSLERLDISNLTGLISLYCSSNALTELDLDSFEALYSLDCSGNNLSKLDLTKCTKLDSLYCSYNNFDEIDISPCKKLTTFSCHGNKLKKLDFTAINTITSVDTIEAKGNGCIGFYIYGAYKTFDAYPDNGESFIGWYDATGKLLSTKKNYFVAGALSNKTVYGIFSGYKLSAPSISASIMDGGGVAINISAVDGAKKYNVYRAVKGGSYALVGTVNETCYVDNDMLTAGKKYYYKVAAVGIAENEGAISAYAAVQLAATVNIPQITAQLLNTAPIITWNEDENAARFEIYRAKKGGSYELVASVNGGSYTDNSALEMGASYYYKVRAIDANGNASALSSYVCLSIPSVPLSAPKLTVKISGGEPKLSWTRVSGAAKYEIYRAVKGGSYEWIATVASTAFTDSDSLSAGKYYYYKVRCIDAEGEFGALSAYAGVKIPAKSNLSVIEID